MTRISFVTALVILVLSNGAFARDDHVMMPIKDALEAPEAESKLDKGIKLFFIGQTHPKVIKNIGEWSTNKKTNSFGKSIDKACNWAFLSAMISLQRRAQDEGGNAVIDIKSNYKNIETSSPTEYMCGDGAFVSGVAFKGTVVKLHE